jgi:hypothetical protein
MADQTVGDFLSCWLRRWGARTVFGYPGGGIDGLLAADRRNLKGVDEPLADVKASLEVVVEEWLARGGPKLPTSMRVELDALRQDLDPHRDGVTA